MPQGLIQTYNKARKVSRSLNEYHRTGKTKEERDVKPIDDDRDGFINLYVVSEKTDYDPELPMVGSVLDSFHVGSENSITYKLLDKNPNSLFFLDVEEGKKFLGDAYGLDVAKTQLSSSGVSDSDVSIVLSHMSDNSIPAYFSISEMTSILSSAGFNGFVYSSPLDKKAFVLWGGLDDLTVSSYSLDEGKTWVEV